MTGSVSTIVFPLYPSLGLLAVSSDAGVQGSVWSGERTRAVFTVLLVLSSGYESAIARVSCCIYAFLAILDCGRVLGFAVVIMWCSWDGVGTGHVRIRRWNRGTEWIHSRFGFRVARKRIVGFNITISCSIQFDSVAIWLEILRCYPVFLVGAWNK
jgi:hypothetical protein